MPRFGSVTTTYGIKKCRIKAHGDTLALCRISEQQHFFFGGVGVHLRRSVTQNEQQKARAKVGGRSLNIHKKAHGHSRAKRGKREGAGALLTLPNASTTLPSLSSTLTVLESFLYSQDDRFFLPWLCGPDGELGTVGRWPARCVCVCDSTGGPGCGGGGGGGGGARVVVMSLLLVGVEEAVVAAWLSLLVVCPVVVIHGAAEWRLCGRYRSSRGSR